MVLASHRFLLDLGLSVCCSVQIFRGRPNFFFLGKVLPYFIRSGEMLHRKHDFFRNEEKDVLRYGVSRSLRVFLCILECVGVLGDALHVLMIVLHLILQF